jgi:hypothetical protein
MSLETTTELLYVVVPRFAGDAFRYVTFTNPLPAPLHEGPIDVSVGRDFLLSSTIHPTAAGAKAELALGVEEAIKVARNTRYSERSSGFFGGGLKLVHDVEIDIGNRLGRPVRMEVRERLPILRRGEEHASIEIVEVDPPWERYEQPSAPVEGAYRWRSTVPAGETETFRVSYAINISSKHEIVGGNRRES